MNVSTPLYSWLAETPLYLLHTGTDVWLPATLVCTGTAQVMTLDEYEKLSKEKLTSPFKDSRAATVDPKAFEGMVPYLRKVATPPLGAFAYKIPDDRKTMSCISLYISLVRSTIGVWGTLWRVSRPARKARSNGQLVIGAKDVSGGVAQDIENPPEGGSNVGLDLVNLELGTKQHIGARKSRVAAKTAKAKQTLETGFRISDGGSPPPPSGDVRAGTGHDRDGGVTCLPRRCVQALTAHTALQQIPRCTLLESVSWHHPLCPGHVLRHPLR